MNYKEIVDYIEEIPKFTTKNPLDHTKELLARLGNPQNQQKVIHVAGTNGKGSVCAYLDSMLRAGGYRVGLFTSPHLVKINERFKINGQMSRMIPLYRLLNRLKESLMRQWQRGWIIPATLRPCFSWE